MGGYQHYLDLSHVAAQRRDDGSIIIVSITKHRRWLLWRWYWRVSIWRPFASFDQDPYCWIGVGSKRDAEWIRGMIFKESIGG